MVMMKKLILNSLLIFVVWTVIDYLVHGYYLHEAYLATADLWRGAGEAKMGLNSVVVFAVSALLALIYIFIS